MSDRSLLTTALVAAQLPHSVPKTCMLRGWLDSWTGVLGYDVRLIRLPFASAKSFLDERGTMTASTFWATGAEGDDLDAHAMLVNCRRAADYCGTVSCQVPITLYGFPPEK
jgi:hypothetical protein